VGILHSEGHPIQHQTKEVQVKLKEAINNAAEIVISSPVGTIGRMLRKEEFAFSVSKKQAREQLKGLLHHEMAKLENSNDVQVNIIPLSNFGCLERGLPTECGKFFLRITFG